MSESKESFSFNSENEIKVKEIIAKYPTGRQKSAVLPLLDLAQRQNGGWLSVASMEHVADIISEPYIRVYEVATFYTMFNLKPIGKYHIQVCGTTPCWLRGAYDVIKTCETITKTKCGTTSADGLFTISEVECLGACRNAPMMQINDDYYEDLDETKIKEIIDTLKSK